MRTILLLCLLSGCTSAAESGTGSVSASLTSATKANAGPQQWPPAPKPRASRCSGPVAGSGTTYNVGPGRKFTELTNVPWLSLKAGDVVNIYHRPTPYRTKFGLRAQGRANAPVIINGVTDTKCRLPEISGERAVTARDAIAKEFFDEEWKTGSLGVIFMHKLPFDEYGTRARHITFQNLKISGGNRRNTYFDEKGREKNYHRGAAGIYAVVGDHITFDNCEVTGNGTGIFFNTKSKEEESSYVIVRNSRIYGNGNPGSWHEHNLYIQVRRSLYEGNYIGQLVPGAKGSSLKDRSSATVVRYNHIDAAARALDLVEIEGGYVTDDPLYPYAWVYGNLIVSDHTRKATSSVLLMHWGGDNDPRYYRNGVLFFYHNTVKTVADKSDHYYLSMFHPEDGKQMVDARFNIFAHQGSAEQYVAYEAGTIDLQGVNWLTKGWAKGQKGVRLLKTGVVIDGKKPPLDQNNRPLPGSDIVDLGNAQAPRRIEGANISHLAVEYEYSKALGMVRRAVKGKAPDLGAFEAR